MLTSFHQVFITDAPFSHVVILVGSQSQTCRDNKKENSPSEGPWAQWTQCRWPDLLWSRLTCKRDKMLRQGHVAASCIPLEDVFAWNCPCVQTS